jgi:hypothetical protein
MASADFSQFVVTTVPFEFVYSFSACETSPGTHTFFHPYTRHVYLERFRAVIGLWLYWQSYPRPRPDMIPVRRVRVLPPPSFRFRLAADTLGLGYDLPTAGRSRDFHPLERALAGRTSTARGAPLGTPRAFVFLYCQADQLYRFISPMEMAT